MSAVEENLHRLHQAHRPHGPHHLVSQSVAPLLQFVHLRHTPHLLEKHAILVHPKYLIHYLLLLYVVIMVEKRATLIRLSRTESLRRHPNLQRLIQHQSILSFTYFNLKSCTLYFFCRPSTPSVTGSSGRGTGATKVSKISIFAVSESIVKEYFSCY